MITDKKQRVQFNDGFTIIESLVAIVIVGILMTAIAPVIILSVGNRVQARRVEVSNRRCEKLC
jgi:prepilin-type N-terminal cleavage/methylation domain-containing protein